MGKGNVMSYHPIEDAAIGDCRCLGLISKQGSLDWLCLPCYQYIMPPTRALSGAIFGCLSNYLEWPPVSEPSTSAIRPLISR